MPVFLNDAPTDDKPACGAENSAIYKRPDFSFENGADRSAGYAFENGAVDIAILNPAPSDGAAERRLAAIFAGSPLPVRVTFVRADGCPAGDGGILYRTFTEIEKQYFDGFLVCGEPARAGFKEYRYWKEFSDILGWTDSNAAASAFIGWSAQAAMYAFYGVKKHNLKERRYGIFSNRKVPESSPEPLMGGISDEFELPHDCFSYVSAADVMRSEELKILAYSRRAGVSVARSADGRRLFITAHPEYDRFALKLEYEKERSGNGLAKPPFGYFADKKMTEVKMNWASASSLLVLNWLNACARNAAKTEEKLGA